MTRRTTLCTAIKWALARPNARWELVAFDRYDQLEWEREWGLSAEYTRSATAR